MKPILITGGAGFIGTNLADRLLSVGQPVVVLDNLSRDGVEHNLRYLCSKHAGLVRVEAADIRDRAVVRRVMQHVAGVYHFAAQTAVTTSMISPENDFDVNARGTLELLEAARTCDEPPFFLYTSTNKVYGGLSDVSLTKVADRYEPEDEALRARGISEQRALDFHTPYGCSKGTADQYVLDYARAFGLPAIVFRMSCIYGPHQCGTEDQGWVAHFALRALAGEPISIYGDGSQVRDLLFVEDLVDALVLARENISHMHGQAYNVGGGVANSASVREVVSQIERLHGELTVSYGDWRPSDQRYYVSDTSKLQAATSWSPRIDVATGVERMYQWLAREHKKRSLRARQRADALEERSA
jgi:CDP-paratose 2-epimerase